jgi:hypothetical protein
MREEGMRDEGSGMRGSYRLIASGSWLVLEKWPRGQGMRDEGPDSGDGH